ncbi:MAG: tetratricopeptide repeat protein [Spirochaetales bacterium]|nr:tetratricopeptide repeat protein [Spirochaetales bacterium]
MKRIVTVLVVLGMLGALSSCGNDDSLLSRMFDLEERAAKNAPPSTVEELKDGIARYGKDVEQTVAAMEKVAMYWRLLAVRYMEQGLFGDAYDAGMKALRHYPQSAGLYYIVGLSAAYLSRMATSDVSGTAITSQAWLSAAEGAYLQALKVEPGHSKSLYGLAVLYTFELEDHEAAIPPIERFLEKEPRNVDALFVYARALYGAGRLQDAADAYDRVINTTTIDEKKKQAVDNKKRILDELYG